MKTLAWFLALCFLFCGLCGVQASNADLAPLKLQSYQAHDFEVGKQRAYESVITVMQDLGCIITSADVVTGYVSAQCPATTRGFFIEPVTSIKWTAFVTSLGKGKSRVRLTAQQTRMISFGGIFSSFYSEDRKVEDPAFYVRFFTRVLETQVQRL